MARKTKKLTPGPKSRYTRGELLEQRRLREVPGVPYWQTVQKELDRRRTYISERVKAASKKRAKVMVSEVTLQFKPIGGKKSALPRRFTARPTKRFEADWVNFSIRKRGGLHQKAIKSAKLSKRQIETVRRGTLTKATKEKLRKAYELTQYAKLRKTGLSIKRSRSISKKLPTVVASVRKDMRKHAQEIIIRKFPDHKKPISKRSFQRAVKKVLSDMSRSNYTPEQWEFFSNWYAKNPKKPLTKGQWRDIRMKPKSLDIEV